LEYFLKILSCQVIGPNIGVPLRIGPECDVKNEKIKINDFQQIAMYLIAHSLLLYRLSYLSTIALQISIYFVSCFGDYKYINWFICEHMCCRIWHFITICKFIFNDYEHKETVLHRKYSYRKRGHNTVDLYRVDIHCPIISVTPIYRNNWSQKCVQFNP